MTFGCALRRGTTLALVAGLSVHDASAASLRLDQRASLAWHDDNGNAATDDDHYGLLVERLTLSGSAEGLDTAAQVSGEQFVGSPDGRYRDDVRLERLSVSQTLSIPSAPSGELTITAGDFYRQIGRGLLLSLRKVDALGLDVTLFGGRLAFADDKHEADVFAGRTHSVSFDGVTQRHVDPVEDVIVSASFLSRIVEGATFGFSAVHLRVDEHLLGPNISEHTTSTGASVEIPALARGLSVYFEGAAQSRKAEGRLDDRLIDEAHRGWASYLTIDLVSGDFGVLVEGLYLDEMMLRGSTNPAAGQRFAYDQPPTLERMDQEVLNNTNVRGGRLRLSYALADGDVLPSLNVAYRQHDPGARYEQMDALHAYTGLDFTYAKGTSRLGFSGGYRQEYQAGEKLKQAIHGEGDWVHALDGGYATHLSVGHEERRLLSAGAHKDSRRGTTLVGLEKQGLGTATAEVGYDTFDTRQSVRALHLAGIVSWDATEAVTLQATGGSQRGGIKCIDGVCRNFPAFTGGKLDVTLRHDLL